MIRSKKWFKASVSLLAAFGSALVVACADDNSESVLNVPMSNTASTCEALNNCNSSGVVPQGNPSSSSGTNGIPLSADHDTVWVVVGHETIQKVIPIYLPPDTMVKWVGQSSLRITEISPLNLDFLDEEGNDPAWVELYNASDKDVDLSGYVLIENLQKLRDKEKNIRKFVNDAQLNLGEEFV